MNSFRHLTRHVRFAVILFYNTRALSSFLPSFFHRASSRYLIFYFTTTLRVFLAAKLWEAALLLSVSSLLSPSWTDERGRDGRGRLATHRACIFLRTCYTQARANRTHMFVDSGTRLENWFLIGYSSIDTFSRYI